MTHTPGDTTPPATTTTASDSGTTTTSPNPVLATRVTVGSLLLFAAGILFLAAVAHSSSEVTWSRLTYLLSGIEAVTFAGVGWLFGREVNRQRADTAEKKADDAEKTATKATVRAATAEAAGAAIKRVVATQSPSGVSDRLGAEPSGPSGPMQHIAAIASIFPD